VFDYGNIASTILGTITETALLPRDIAYTISCDSPVPVSITWTDSRTGTAVRSNAATSGLTDDLGLNTLNSVRIGRYQLWMVPAGSTGDGNPVSMRLSAGPAAPWVSFTGGYLFANGLQRHSFTAGGRTDSVFRLFEFGPRNWLHCSSLLPRPEHRSHPRRPCHHDR
jgi:hypothetical protein